MLHMPVCHTLLAQLFKGANQKFRNVPWRKLERQRHDRERTPQEHARQVAKLVGV